MNDFEAKIRMVHAMVRRKQVPQLIAALEDPAIRPGPLGTTLSVRRTAHDALVAMGEGAAPELRRALEGSLGAPRAAAIVHVLCDLASPSADEALIWLLGREEAGPMPRWVAAGALGARRVGSSAEALLALLADSDPRVRGSAAWSLGRLPLEGDLRDRACLALRLLLADPECAEKAAASLEALDR